MSTPARYAISPAGSARTPALVQETEADRYGFLVFIPIYSENLPEETIAHRREALQGFTLGVFQFPSLVDNALASIPTGDIHIALIDESASEGESLLYFRPSQVARQSDLSFANAFAPGQEMQRTSSLEVGGRQWSIRCAPSAAFLAAGYSPYPNRLLGICIGFSAMLSAFLFLALRRARELVDMNARLRIEVEKRRKAEEEKEKLESHLNQAKKMEALGTLAGGIAHDFNNFLAAIAGYAQLAEQSVSDGSQAQSDMNEILRISDTAKNVIQEILTFSRPSKSEVTTVNAANLLREAIAIMRVSLPASVDIQEEIDEDSVSIRVDPTRMKQVLLNICTNAYQSMEDKPGLLTIGLSSVRLYAPMVERDFEAAKGEYCAFTITDTGRGMPEEALDRVFDPYYTTKSERRGTGLGLSIVHGIVKEARGIVNVASLQGGGSEFCVLIPVAESMDDTEEVSAPKARQSDDRRHVLLVDDEPDVLRVTSRMLRKLGFGVDAFENPVEGLHAFESSSEKFDLVFLDATMPTMSGLELARSIQGIKSVRIVLASGNLDK